MITWQSSAISCEVHQAEGGRLHPLLDTQLTKKHNITVITFILRND